MLKRILKLIFLRLISLRKLSPLQKTRAWIKFKELNEILGILICFIIAGCVSWNTIIEYDKDNKQVRKVHYRSIGTKGSSFSVKENTIVCENKDIADDIKGVLTEGIKGAVTMADKIDGI